MTEKEKRDLEQWYNPNFDEELQEEMRRCKDHCFDYNQCRPSCEEEKKKLLEEILRSECDVLGVLTPFHCDYGYQIRLGAGFFANHGLVILDGGKVTFGRNVFVGPNCGFYTATHPFDPELRAKGFEKTLPITVGDDVWFGGGVQVLGGVTIGSNVVVGSGSVVTKDIPSNVVAVGNPCKIIRKLDESEDKLVVL